MTVYMDNGVFKFMVLDSESGISQLDWNLRFESIICLKTYMMDRPTLNGKENTASKITSFNKQSSALVFTFANKIGFVKVRTAQHRHTDFGGVMCTAAHFIELVDA